MLYVANNILVADTINELLDFLDAYHLDHSWIEINGRIRPRILYRLYGNMKQRAYTDPKTDIVSLRELVQICKQNNPVTEEEIKEWEKKNGKLPKPPQEVLDRIWEKIKERINNNKK